MKLNLKDTPERMAQIRVARRTGLGNSGFAPALATSFINQCLVRHARRSRCCGGLRSVATALVPRLVPALAAAGILFQPVHWPMHSVPVLLSDHHAAGLGVAPGGQGCVAA